MYVKVPEPVSKETFVKTFGFQAFTYYKYRIESRIADGFTYQSPLKTMYIWAYQDR